MSAQTRHEAWMHAAIEQARRAIEAGQTPFGAVIVANDHLVAAGHNEVHGRTDPTAHAEVIAIRRAATDRQRIDLAGCTMYTTCEPCPMCASAIHWAKLDAVFFGAAIDDAMRAGFSELAVPIQELYRQGGGRVAVAGGLMADECAALFQEWLAAGRSAAY